MAYNDIPNSVPLGVAGTGNAYILPQSQAISNIDDYIDQTAARKAKAAALKNQQAAQLAKAWQDNQLKIKGGTLYQPEINQRAEKVIQMGLDLQKSGINPNVVSTNPQSQSLLEEYQRQKAALLRDVDTRDDIVSRATANEKALAQQPAGYYDHKSVNDYHDFISGKIPLSEISSKGLMMPELKRAFSLDGIVEKIPGVPIKTSSVDPISGVKKEMVLPNVNAHSKLAINLVNTNPEVQADIADKAGIPYTEIGDETNVDKLKKQIDDYYRSAPNVGQLADMGITTYQDPKYDAMLTAKAKQAADAARIKKDYIGGIKETLDNKVHQSDEKSWDFAYQHAQESRERLGMEREKHSKWKEDQQNEAGDFSLGNQDSFVPVIKTKQLNGGQGKSYVEPERGASLYGVNLPAVRVIARPSEVTDMKTGKTLKNTSPMDVAISQIQMVPVFKGLSKNDPRNGSEISARQLKEIVDGKHNFAKLQNIEFKPFAYGIKSEKDENNVHTAQTPVKFSYDALKGVNGKKINTTTFDQATEQLKLLQENPKFRQMAPQDQLDFISKKYNIKLD